MYFEPVALDRPDFSLRSSKGMFGQNIRINTPNAPIDEISNYQVAIMGVCEDRNSHNEGASLAPDQIRTSLYQLFKVNDKVRIIDLGNLKKTDSISDIYYGMRDVMLELLNNQLVVVVLGGTQDITHGAYMAFEVLKTAVNMVTIDPRIDMEKGETGSMGWMKKTIKSPTLFGYTNLGHQQYLVNKELLEHIEKQFFESIRLGTIRSNLGMTEPILRDAHLVSFDVSAIRQSDAPATIFPSPNGFMAEEACQLARYAGLSDHVSCFGIYEINPRFDMHHQSTHLAAQMVWYFIEGFVQRKIEKPMQGNPDFKVFVVSHQDMEHELTFYKSLVTNRWWMQVPEINSGKTVLVSCSQEEYQQACTHEIPDLWWKIYQRIN